MENVDWKGVAKYLLEQENHMRMYNFPEPAGVLVEWNGDMYIGSIQEIAPEFSKEIVLLSKSSYKIPVQLAGAIRDADPERRTLCADDDLELEGRQHILKMSDNKLEYMTPEQTKYITENMPIITEI